MINELKKGRKVLEESERIVKPYKKDQPKPTASPFPSYLSPRSFDSSVMALVNKHLAQLKRVFRFYSTRVDGNFNKWMQCYYGLILFRLFI